MCSPRGSGKETETGEHAPQAGEGVPDRRLLRRGSLGEDGVQTVGMLGWVGYSFNQSGCKVTGFSHMGSLVTIVSLE